MFILPYDNKKKCVPCSCFGCCLEGFLFLELLLRVGDLPAFAVPVAADDAWTTAAEAAVAAAEAAAPL